jgi:2-haloacid dehalogenase
VRAVVFDVGNVLYHWDMRALFAKLIADPAELDWFLAHVVTEEWHFQHDAGRPLAAMVPARIAAFPAYETHLNAYATRFNETIPGPVAGMLDLVTALNDAGVPLFGITNFGAEFWDMFRPTAPIFDLFRDIVVSGVEKCAKPDPEIYALALRRFGLAPGEGLFVDDRLENVEAARRNGFAAHHFTDAPRLRAALVTAGMLLQDEREPDRALFS